jgi:hypothetical protein
VLKPQLYLFSDGSTGATLAHRVIEFTGSITGNQIVTIPIDVEKLFYFKKFNIRCIHSTI